MALPPTPPGYNNWNQYISVNAPAIAAAQGITLQQAKESIKCGNVAMPVRQAVGTPSFRIYNVWIDYASSTHAPTEGRPWLIGTPIPAGTGIVTQTQVAIVSQLGQWLVTGP